MTKIILISDIHMTKPGVLIAGLDPERRLTLVRDDIRAHHDDADHIILMVLGPGSSGLSDATPGGYGILLLRPSGPILRDMRVGLANGPISEDSGSRTPGSVPRA